ncbi:MFS transporter [Microbacterium yannicii]|uniref:MFS transporter n=1 Tax=Microbacterium yannicii TaxID=671622 RepID=A0ABP9M704_9MICO|nr:MFS transporter [Microbacterium yannicii]MCO5952441.1 MFS transporter [Microbacterium yannicii]
MSVTAAGPLAKQEFRTWLPALIFSTVGVAFGYTALAYFVGPLVIPLGEEFGWNRGDVTQTTLWSAVALAVMLPFTGSFADRRGTRLVFIIAIPIFAAVTFSLAFFDGPLWLFLSTYAVLGVVGTGTSAVMYAKVVATAFDKARGLALGIVSAGLGSVAIFFPVLMGWAIQTWGWRSTYVIMTICALIPLVLVFFVKLPDDRKVRAASAAPLPGISPREALRGRAFWTLLVIFLLVGFALVSMVPHFVPLLIDTGVDPLQAAALSSLVGIGTVIARPVIGWFLDRYDAIKVGAPLFLLAAVGLLLLQFGGAGFAPVTALLVGIGFGAEVDLASYLSSRYLGPRAYGRLYGIIYGAFSIGAGLGPVVAGYIFAAQGSYATALILSASLIVVGVILLLTLPRTPRVDPGVEAPLVEADDPIAAK